MGSSVPLPQQQLMFRARQKLGLMQAEMADAVGTSLRTLSRWEAGDSTPADVHLHKVAKLLHPLDPELAKEAARWAGATLEQLGIVQPPAPPAPPPAPVAPPPPEPVAPPPEPLPARLLVDAVVCAVAAALEALDGAPVSVARARAAVAAAFASARDLRLSVDEAAAALAPPPRKRRMELKSRPMTTPQNPGKRRKQKIRRTKQLAAWRAKQPASDSTKTAKAEK
jgi:DNA-binding XRE family transcriptional regulator